MFVYTPKGEVKELPSGATPIDFAYRIHTDIGHKCSGAKVNGKLTSLDYQLEERRYGTDTHEQQGSGPKA